jgi:hypothetical protein
LYSLDRGFSLAPHQPQPPSANPIHPNPDHLTSLSHPKATPCWLAKHLAKPKSSPSSQPVSSRRLAVQTTICSDHDRNPSRHRRSNPICLSWSLPFFLLIQQLLDHGLLSPPLRRLDLTSKDNSTSHTLSCLCPTYTFLRSIHSSTIPTSSHRPDKSLASIVYLIFNAFTTSSRKDHLQPRPLQLKRTLTAPSVPNIISFPSTNFETSFESDESNPISISLTSAST